MDLSENQDRSSKWTKFPSKMVIAVVIPRFQTHPKLVLGQDAVPQFQPFSL